MWRYLRLVDDTHDDHPGDASSILGGLALSVIKVGGDGNHGVCHLLTEISLGRLLHLNQNHGGNLLRSEGLLSLSDIHGDMGLAVLLDHLKGEVFDVVLDGGLAPRATDQTLGVKDGVLGVGRQLVLGGISDETLALGGESDVGRGDTVTLVVSDDLNTAVLVYSNTGGKKQSKV